MKKVYFENELKYGEIYGGYVVPTEDVKEGVFLDQDALLILDDLTIEELEKILETIDEDLISIDMEYKLKEYGIRTEYKGDGKPLPTTGIVYLPLIHKFEDLAYFDSEKYVHKNYNNDIVFINEIEGDWLKLELINPVTIGENLKLYDVVGEDWKLKVRFPFYQGELPIGEIVEIKK